jgi:hypothetical protein
MRHLSKVVGFVAGMCLIVSAIAQADRTWWASGELGAGDFKLHSDQVTGTREPVFGLGFAGGHRLNDKARIGLHVKGWLVEAYDLNYPAQGESVTNVMGVVDVFPLRAWERFFMRGGLGLSIYSVNRATAVGGKGLVWEGAVGYEIPLNEKFFLSPAVEYSEGRLGDVLNHVGPATNRRFSVIGFKMGASYHFGSRKGVWNR